MHSETKKGQHLKDNRKCSVSLVVDVESIITVYFNPTTLNLSYVLGRSQIRQTGSAWTGSLHALIYKTMKKTMQAKTR